MILKIMMSAILLGYQQLDDSHSIIVYQLRTWIYPLSKHCACAKSALCRANEKKTFFSQSETMVLCIGGPELGKDLTA